MNEVKYYRHHPGNLSHFGVLEPEDVDFGKAKTFKGFAKKFKEAGYKEVVVTLGRDKVFTNELANKRRVEDEKTKNNFHPKKKSLQTEALQ